MLMKTPASPARPWFRLAAAFLAAVATTAVLGGLVQTQVNIAAITALGVPVSASLRAVTTVEDVVRFGPVMAAIAAGAFLPAFAAAILVARWLPERRTLVCALAGATGLFAAFWIMGFFTPMPTLVAAIRGPAGLAAMCATGLVGGAVFARLSARR